MKFLALAAVATAFVAPDFRMTAEIVLDDKPLETPPVNNVVNSVPTVDNLLAVEEIESCELRDGVFYPPEVAEKPFNFTVYQIITLSKHTTQFAALVDAYPDLVAKLNGTAANHTLFVPLDKAFAKLPGGRLNATGAALEAIVRYHVGLGDYPYKSIYAVHTVPTDLNETLLGGQPQRLRTRFAKKGLHLNFDTRVVSANFIASNGVVHGVDSVIFPRTFAGREVFLAPARFSTYFDAMDKTNFVRFAHGLVLNGSTLFAPSDVAFTKLGPSLNDFLFNTPRGLKYLHALLRYSVVPNATVYSDAYYGPAQLVTPQPGAPFSPVTRLHYDLPTVLAPNASIGLNVTRFPGYIAMLANHAVPVTVQDTIAKNGVIQETGRVLIPPRPNPDGDDAGFPWWDYEKVATVADLVAHLRPYVDDPEDEDIPEMSEL